MNYLIVEDVASLHNTNILRSNEMEHGATSIDTSTQAHGETVPDYRERPLKLLVQQAAAAWYEQDTETYDHIESAMRYKLGRMIGLDTEVLEDDTNETRQQVKIATASYMAIVRYCVLQRHEELTQEQPQEPEEQLPPLPHQYPKFVQYDPIPSSRGGKKMQLAQAYEVANDTVDFSQHRSTMSAADRRALLTTEDGLEYYLAGTQLIDLARSRKEKQLLVWEVDKQLPPVVIGQPWEPLGPVSSVTIPETIIREPDRVDSADAYEPGGKDPFHEADMLIERLSNTPPAQGGKLKAALGGMALGVLGEKWRTRRQASSEQKRKRRIAAAAVAAGVIVVSLLLAQALRESTQPPRQGKQPAPATAPSQKSGKSHKRQSLVPSHHPSKRSVSGRVRTLAVSGDTIWAESARYLRTHGYSTTLATIDRVKDAVLRRQHLSEAAAHYLLVGYEFTIPRYSLKNLARNH